MIAIISGFIVVFCWRIQLGLNINWYSEVFHQIYFERSAEYMDIKTVIIDVGLITVDFHVY